jgi:hypothetical protein
MIIPVAGLYSVKLVGNDGWIMNSRVFGRKWLWTNQNTISVFAWREGASGETTKTVSKSSCCAGSKSNGAPLAWACGRSVPRSVVNRCTCILDIHAASVVRLLWARRQRVPICQATLKMEAAHFSQGARSSVEVNALCCTPEGHCFEARWGEWIVSIYVILPVTVGLGVYSASNRNEYQKQKKKCFWGAERWWRVGLTTVLPSVSRLSRHWDPQHLDPIDLHGLLRGDLYFLHFSWYQIMWHHIPGEVILALILVITFTEISCNENVSYNKTASHMKVKSCHRFWLPWVVQRIQQIGCCCI